MKNMHFHFNENNVEEKIQFRVEDFSYESLCIHK